MSNNYGYLHLIAGDDGRCFLLDIESDRILHLNAVGAEVWKLVVRGDTESEIVTQIARKYQVNEGRVEADVRALRKRISELRLSPSETVTADSSQPKRKGSQQPSYPWYGDSGANRPQPSGLTVLAAFAGLSVFDFILWARSLKSLCFYVKAWPVWKCHSTDSETTGKVCSAVDRACVWYPKQALCLQRSAVTACLLRSFGIRAQMKIGVRPMPFLAHAWVEVGGAVVNDFPGVRAFYNSLASY